LIPLLGVVSRFQDNNSTVRFPDLAVAKRKGFVGAIIKILQGDVIDEDAARFIKSANAAGLPWSPHSWPDLLRDDMEAQADRLAAVASQLNGGAPLPLPPSPDLEEDELPGMAPLEVAQKCRAYVDRLKLNIPGIPMVYSFNDWWDHWIASTGIDFSDCFMRTADYRDAWSGMPANPLYFGSWLKLLKPIPAKPNKPTPWKPDPTKGFEDRRDGYDAWQFTCAWPGNLADMESTSVCVNVIWSDVWEDWSGLR
jgi:hypothetical protein